MTCRPLATSPWMPAAALLLAVTAAGLGCASSGGNTAGDASMTFEPPTVVGTDPASLEQAYLVGPAAASDMAYRIDWQTNVSAQRGMRKMVVQYDSVFTLDGRNYLTRLKTDTGQRLATSPIAKAQDNILGITMIPHLERVFVNTESDMYIVDPVNGALVDRRRMQDIVSTGVAVVGPMMVAGSANGQIIWYSYVLGQRYNAYKIARTIEMTPIVSDEIVVAVGSGGELVVVDVELASAIWAKNWLGPLRAEPVVGPQCIYVASTDQSLYAFDRYSGRTVWSYLSESRLVDSPTLIGDRIYQFIASEGLVCFEAVPEDTLDGRKLWTADVRGNVVCEHDGKLLVWDDETRRMTILDRHRGHVVGTRDLPAVRHLHATKVMSGHLYASGDDGRVTRLVPRAGLTN